MPIQHKYMDNSDIFKFLSRSSHFSTKHDAEYAAFIKENNTGQSFRNDLNGLNAHFLVQLFLCTLNISVGVSVLSTTVSASFNFYFGRYKKCSYVCI